MKKDSEEFSQMQRERIMQTKPWEKSTGPKTFAGKEASKMNALKVNPELYELLKQAEEIYKNQQELLNMINN